MTISSSTLGVIIPPSIPMVVYSSIASCSISALFMGGIIPGILIGFGQMFVIYLLGKKHPFPAHEKVPAKEVWKITLQSIPGLLTPVIILGGVLGGVMTATESACIACFYALILGMFVTRTIHLKDIPALLVDTLLLNSVSLFALAAANAMGQLLAYYNLSVVVKNFFTNYVSNRIIFMLLVILLAIGCAVVSILFCRGLQKTGKLAARLLPNPYGRVLVGGALVIVLTLLVGNTNYNGAGMEMVEQAVSGDVEPWAWLWKLLFTAVTIGFGYKGGEVVPSFFVGACFGCVLGGAMGLPAGFGAAIGLVAVFCGAVNCPIASVFLSIELFSTGDVLYFAMACAISYLLSGYCGLYSSQTILYSKMRAEFINIHTNENEEHHG